MSHKRCFVYLCSAFPIIDILCFTSVVLYICVMISLLLVFYVSQALFCISVLWIPHNLYFMYSQALFCISVFCFPYYWYISLLFMVWQVLFCISVLWFSHNWYFMFHKRCFVYLCYDFLIIGILCFTRVVLYICVLLSLLLVFYVSQALFCISLLWFPYYWYFMSHKRCFVYLCYDFPIIGILCIKHCFVYLCSAFPIIGILCFASVVLYIFVLLSLLMVFYVSQALFCISLLWFPYYWYFMYHKRCFVYLCSAFPIIGILCFTSVVLYICVMISL